MDKVSHFNLIASHPTSRVNRSVHRTTRGRTRLRDDDASGSVKASMASVSDQAHHQPGRQHEDDQGQANSEKRNFLECRLVGGLAAKPEAGVVNGL